MPRYIFSLFRFVCAILVFNITDGGFYLMSSFFSIDSPFFSFMSKVADIVLLNLLYIICCLPIFTVGAATSALYYQVMKMSRNEESYVFRGFFKAFRENFRKATPAWLILLVIGLLLFLDLYLSPVFGNTAVINGFRIICYIAAIFWMMAFAYAFPLFSKFENTVRNTLSNAILMGIRHLPLTFVILFLDLSPVLAVIFLTPYLGILLLLMLLCWFSGVAFLNGFLFHHIFSFYIPKEETVSSADSDTAGEEQA